MKESSIDNQQSLRALRAVGPTGLEAVGLSEPEASIDNPKEDERYYIPCPIRKNRARIPLTVCHKQKCLFLSSEDGKLKCGYGDPNKRWQK